MLVKLPLVFPSDVRIAAPCGERRAQLARTARQYKVVYPIPYGSLRTYILPLLKGIPLEMVPHGDPTPQRIKLVQFFSKASHLISISSRKQ